MRSDGPLSILLLACLLPSLVSAKLGDFASMINYKEFVADFSKEALATYADNLADPDSGDACRDFAKVLVQEPILWISTSAENFSDIF
jgi:hypothetical protein